MFRVCSKQQTMKVGEEEERRKYEIVKSEK
jgi:hypothetical protein